MSPPVQPARVSIPFDYCTITSHHDTAPQFHRSSFAGLADYLRSHVRMIPMTHEEFNALVTPEMDKDQRNLGKVKQSAAKDGPAIILAKYKPGTRRSNENVEHTTGIGLDVDTQHVELSTILAALDGVAAIIYESSRSTPTARRWRVLIPYTVPATSEQHMQAFAYWSARIPGVGVQSKDDTRLWYGVQQFRGSPKRMFEEVAGVAFDPTTIGKMSSKEAFKHRITLPVGAPAAEGNRNAEMNRYATAVVKDCESESELFAMMLDVNRTYAPELPPAEVRAIAKRKWAKRAMFGWVPPAIAGERVDAQVNEDDEAVGVDAAALFDTDHGPVPWVIDNILTYGAHLLVGRAKGGKSWLTMDMSLAVGAGSEFLGHPCRQSGVLWISGEDTRASLGRRLRVRGERPQNVCIMTMEDIVTERAKYEDCTFDAWLRSYLETHPQVGLVIIDTHRTVEAKWNNEQIDKKRSASITDIAYQEVRLYETIGKTLMRAIVLVHHQGKMKHNKGTDYHERVNLPATVVAGVAASLVLSDHPDRDIHDEDDRRRVFSTRGRDIIKDQNLMIEFTEGRVKLLGGYADIAKNEAFAEVMETVEALLNESDTTTIEAVAKALCKHRTSVQRVLGIAAKRPGGIVWKGRTLKSKQRVGLYWDRT